MRTKDTNGYLQPAATVIARFGGAPKLAMLLGLDKSTVCQWRNPQREDGTGGTGGAVPGKHHGRLLELAKEMGVRLRPADLIQRSTPPRLPARRFQPPQALTG